jgi:hypothetical protein
MTCRLIVQSSLQQILSSYNTHSFPFCANLKLDKLPRSLLILESMSSSTLSSRTQLEQGEQPQDASSPVTNTEGGPITEENEKANNTSNTTIPLLVDWEPNDKDNPRNWSVKFKVWCTFQLSLLAVAASLGSSIITPGTAAITEYTGISSELSVLSISLYM